MGIHWIARHHPDLDLLLKAFVRSLPDYLPETRSAVLFGGAALGGFSPRWSSLDLMVWVEAGEITPDVQKRAGRLWDMLSGWVYGERLALYVGPLSIISGPSRTMAGGVPLPRSLRVYQQGRRPVEGYPLNLAERVSLARYGEVLHGEDLRHLLPPIPENWPTLIFQHGVAQTLTFITRGQGPFGPDPAQGAANWGPALTMARPLWYARHLYSMRTGEMLAKEHAGYWYLGRRGQGALPDCLRLALRWRERGDVSAAELARMARLIPPATVEFLQEGMSILGFPPDEVPLDLFDAVHWCRDRLHTLQAAR